MSETEYSVPAKWKEVRRQCAEFLEYPGTPSTKPIEWCIQIIDDLACAEAQFAVANERIAELERIIASMKLADDEKADSLNSYRVALETAIGQRDEARRGQVTDEENFHFTDDEIIGSICGADFLVSRVLHKLTGMTGGEKWSLYRAVVKLALASRAPQTVTDEQIGNAMREAGYDTAGTKAEIFWEAVKASRARKGSPK